MKDVKEITAQLEEGLGKVFTSKEYVKYLNVMSKFHNYSFGNCALILMQKPDASLVAGYKAWQTKFKRFVRKGEKGINILAPMPRTIKSINEETGEEEERKYTAYRAVTVFDVSQTDGEELPMFSVSELTGEVNGYEKFMTSLKDMASVPVKFEKIENGAKGYCAKDEIVINTGMSELQTVKTMIHELAHHILNHLESDTDKRTKEVEAESVAYVVAQFFGMDTSDYSFKYIAKWAGKKDKKIIHGVLGNIQRTADKIIKGCAA